MRYLLSESSRGVLSNLAHAKTLCAFDFDGTLAPIVDHPDEARLPAGTRGLLMRLAELYPCVILSGRSRADLVKKLTGLRVNAAIGNHGAEPTDLPADGLLAEHGPLVGQWKATIEEELRPIPGLWVESKGRSLAVHYRMSPVEDVGSRVLTAARHLRRAKVYEGNKVVNIVIEGDPHKGTALEKERDRLECDSVLYVGDDTNDEPAFAIGGNIVAVRIGLEKNSHAAFYLKDQTEIDKLLELLVVMRQQA